MDEMNNEYADIVHAIKQTEKYNEHYHETKKQLEEHKAEQLSKAQQRRNQTTEDINRKRSTVESNREQGWGIIQSLHLDNVDKKILVEEVSQASSTEQGFESAFRKSNEATSNLANAKNHLIRVRDAIWRSRRLRRRLILGAIGTMVTAVVSTIGFTAYSVNQQMIANETATGVYIANATGTVQRAIFNVTAAAANATSTAQVLQAQNLSTVQAIQRQATLDAGGFVSINGSEFDTYPGGYRVSVKEYQIDFTREVVRVYFEASASRSDLRSPNGTYLVTNSGNINPLSSSSWSSSSTYYSGYFDFDARYFRNQAGLHLMYCGCGLYDISLRDLRNNFN